MNQLNETIIKFSSTDDAIAEINRGFGIDKFTTSEVVLQLVNENIFYVDEAKANALLKHILFNTQYQPYNEVRSYHWDKITKIRSFTQQELDDQYERVFKELYMTEGINKHDAFRMNRVFSDGLIVQIITKLQTVLSPSKFKERIPTFIRHGYSKLIKKHFPKLRLRRRNIIIYDDNSDYDDGKFVLKEAIDNKIFSSSHNPYLYSISDDDIRYMFTNAFEDFFPWIYEEMELRSTTNNRQYEATINFSSRPSKLVASIATTTNTSDLSFTIITDDEYVETGVAKMLLDHFKAKGKDEIFLEHVIDVVMVFFRNLKVEGTDKLFIDLHKDGIVGIMSNYVLPGVFKYTPKALASKLVDGNNILKQSMLAVEGKRQEYLKITATAMYKVLVGTTNFTNADVLANMFMYNAANWRKNLIIYGDENDNTARALITTLFNEIGGKTKFSIDGTKRTKYTNAVVNFDNIASTEAKIKEAIVKNKL